MLILQKENLHTIRSHLGRVQILYPGNDKQCRAVSVKKSKGLMKGAVNQLCVLPKDDDLYDILLLKISIFKLYVNISIYTLAKLLSTTFIFCLKSGTFPVFWKHSF